MCLVRDRSELQVLMVQRPHTSRFMPDTWVFPGGAVDDGDAEPVWNATVMDDWRAAAVRELIEETGLWITSTGVGEYGRDPFVMPDGITFDGDALVYFSNWITPEPFPIRFDTRFYLAVAHGNAEGAIDGDELVDLAWVNPLEALGREMAGEWDIAFPTRMTLELLGSQPDADSLDAAMRSLRIVPPIQPRLYVGEDEARIVMPDDPMFEAIERSQRDPGLLDRLAKVVSGGGRVPAEFKGRG